MMTTACLILLVATGFVICLLLRPSRATRVPGSPATSNGDFRLFVHLGTVRRDNVKQGMVTFHPAGFAADSPSRNSARGAIYARHVPTGGVMLDTPGDAFR